LLRKGREIREELDRHVRLMHPELIELLRLRIEKDHPNLEMPLMVCTPLAPGCAAA